MNPLMLLFKSAVIILIAGLACFIMRRRSAAARYIVWLAAMLGVLLLPLGALLPGPAAPMAGLAIDAVSTGAIARPASSPITWTLLWNAGSLILLIRLFLQLKKARAIIAASHRLKLENGYEVHIASGLATPVAWGLGRKLMLLPDSAAEWDDERRRIVLMHESGHLNRNDCWALLIAELTCALFWCNPLIWYAAAMMRREQEHAADDDVLSHGVEATEYASHLVAIARTGKTLTLAAGAVHQSDLTVRVHAILDPGRVRNMATRRMLIFVAIALLSIALPLASMQAQRKVYKVSESGIIKPKLVQKEEPKYTQAAREAKIEGTVVLSAIIEPDGKIHEATVEKGLDDGLDANAITAVKTWRFDPAQKDGEPVAVSVKIEVHFRLL